MALTHQRKDVLAKLLNNIIITSKKLHAKITNVEYVSHDAVRKIETSLLQIKKEKNDMIQRLNRESDGVFLEKKKEKMIKQYDEMTRQAEDKKVELNEAFSNELAAIRDNLMLLNSINKTVKEGENTYEDVLKMLDTVEEVTENVEHLPRVKTYEYFEYIPGQQDLVGKLVNKEKSVFPCGPTPELQGEG